MESILEILMIMISNKYMVGSSAVFDNEQNHQNPKQYWVQVDGELGIFYTIV